MTGNVEEGLEFILTLLHHVPLAWRERSAVLPRVQGCGARLGEFGYTIISTVLVFSLAYSSRSDEQNSITRLSLFL